MLGGVFMNIDELFKKRLLFFFTSFIFIVIVTISSSYAIKENVDNSRVINNENIEIVFENNQDDVHYSEYPLSYEQGIKLSPSNLIRVINNGSDDKRYDIYIRGDETTSSLDINKVYYSIDGREPRNLGSDITNAVYSGLLAGNEEKVINIKVWAASELIDNNDQGKELDLHFLVIEDDI